MKVKYPVKLKYSVKLKHLVCLTSLLTPVAAYADFLSISAGAGVWNDSPDGNFQKTVDPAAVDVNENLFWGSESQGYAFVTIEHFVPIIPNFRLIYTKLDHAGSGSTSFTFDGETFTGNVSNNISIETTDLIAYYEVLDNLVSLDLGLVVRNLKVDYAINSSSSTSSDSLNETVPMLYVLVGASPWPELIISGELSYVAFDGSSVSDFTAKIAYTTDYFLGFEAGYRQQNFAFDDISGTDADLNFDGVFAGAYVKF